MSFVAKLHDSKRMKVFPETIFIDSCAYHPAENSEQAAASELRKLCEVGQIICVNPQKVDEELSHAQMPLRRERLARITTINNLGPLDDAQKQVKREIRELLFGNKPRLEANESNDVDIIFDAKNHEAGYLVTYDKKHLLSKATEIDRRFNMKVVTPSECLRQVQDWFAQHG